MASGAPLAFAPAQAPFTDRFERPQIGDHITYDVAPDGRFLMIAASVQSERRSTGRNELHVVINWFEELKTRASRK